MSYPDDMREAAGASRAGTVDGPAGTLHPDDRSAARNPSVADDAPRPADVQTARMPDGSRRASHDDHGEDRDVVGRFTPVHERTKLLVATAIMAALTLLLVVVTTITVVSHAADDEPVLVDGVPCLVQDGEDGQALLFCQR